MADVCITLLFYQGIASEVTQQHEMKLRCNRWSCFGNHALLLPICSGWVVLRAVCLNLIHYDIIKASTLFCIEFRAAWVESTEWSLVSAFWAV